MDNKQELANSRYCTTTQEEDNSFSKSKAFRRHSNTQRTRTHAPARAVGQSRQHCDGAFCIRIHQRQQHEVHEDQVEQHLEAHVDGEEANRVNGHLGIIYGTRVEQGRAGPGWGWRLSPLQRNVFSSGLPRADVSVANIGFRLD